MKTILYKTIMKELEKRGYKAYLVGGSVRDELLGRKTNDYDIATDALPSDLIKIFGTPSKSVTYGCYTMKDHGVTIDITTFKEEKKYVDGHPIEIVYTNDVLIDAKRRDFTINAIYKTKHGSFLDPYHGLEHLKKKKIVCIGNPDLRFLEDPLRMLRAIRFASLLHFTLQQDVFDAILKRKELILTLSKERIKKELDGIFLANGFSLLNELGIDTLLGFSCLNIIYVHDLAGLWVQIQNAEDFPLEKELKNSIKKISKILNCGTISMYDIYENGLYLSYTCADLLKIDRLKIEKMYQSLPIHSRKEIKLSALSIKRITKCEDSEISSYIMMLETALLEGKVKNKKNKLRTFLERRSKNANA